MREKDDGSIFVWLIVLLFSAVILFSGIFIWLISDSEGQSAAENLLGRELSASSADEADKKPIDMEITAGVTHSIEGEYRNILITSGETVLKNKTVTGDITIADSVKDGIVTLENIVVRGKIIVNGGSQINLNDVTAIEVVSQYENNTTRYNIGGKSLIHQLTAGNDIIIDESGLKNGYTGIKAIVAPKGKKLRRVVLKSGSVEQKSDIEDDSSSDNTKADSSKKSGS